MKAVSVLLLSLHCAFAMQSTEEHVRDKRGVSMLRMGKRASSLLERSSGLPPLVPPAYDAGEDFEEREVFLPDGEFPRQIWVPRVGKDLDMVLNHLSERAPPFPRLGKTFDEYIEEYRRALGDGDVVYGVAGRSRSRRSAAVAPGEEEVEIAGDAAQAALGGDSSERSKSQQKRAAAFPRLGLRDEMEERATPFPRLGLYQRATPFPRLGLFQRATPFPRLGLRDEEDDNELESRAAPFPRIGLRDDDEFYPVNDERATPFPRLGLQQRAFPRLGLLDKRAVSMLRMGRSDDTQEEETAEKRGMSMLRMGKRGMSMLRMGKRPVNMLRMGRSQNEAEEEEEKRSLGMLRMGKRALGMLRMGRSDAAEDEKRSLGMLRMGKRALGMLRMGRSDSEGLEEEEEKRALGMLRMGRGMSMLRMGKRPGVSMLRMGKRDADMEEQAADNES